MKIITLISLAIALTSLHGFSNQNSTTDSKSVPIIDNEEFDYENEFFDDFKNGIDPNNWYISKRAWGEVNGRVNGGVIPQNVSYSTENGGFVRLYARGKYYLKKEFNGVGSVKDGSLTGSVLILKQDTGPGRYEVRMKVAPRVGICNAFWTYTEDENNNNHEIDIELPGQVNGKNSFKNVLFTNYIGESTSNISVLDYYLSDNEYHTYCFDWYYSNNNKLINYYIDGKLLATSTNNIPFLNTKLWLGVWIPNNPDFVGEPLFDTAYMDVDYVRYIPFKNQASIEKTNYVGQVASLDEYPSTPIDLSSNNRIPNGDFEYYKTNPTFNSSGLEYTSTKSIGIEYGNNSYGLRLINSSVSSKIDSCYDVNKFNLSIDYKGEGNIKVEYYSSDDVLLGNDHFVLKENNTYTKFNTSITCPNNSFYIIISVHTSSTIDIDNWYLGENLKIEDDKPINSELTSYGVNISYNENITFANQYSGIAYLDFTNTNQNWVISNGGYYKDQFPLILSCAEATLETSSLASIHLLNGNSKEEITFKNINDAILKEPSMNNEQHFVQAMYMDFDIKDFNDIAFYINGYSEPSGIYYRNVILYSIDQGNSWEVLKINMVKDSQGLSTSYMDNYQIVANKEDLNVINFNQIRFAYAYVAFTVGGEGVRLSGISINRYHDFVNKIDNDIDICNYSLGKQDFLKTQYNNLNNEEYELIKNTNRKNTADETYLEGYEYLLRHWSKNDNLKINDIIYLKNNKTNIIVISICLTPVILSAFIYIILRKKRMKRASK